MSYTYLIGWSEHNKFYYGARWAKNCSPEDLWTTYFTSSKHVKAFSEEYGKPDIIQVRKIFSDADKCKLHERKVLERLNVLRNDKWLNKNINGMFLPTGPMTEEHIANRVASFKRTMQGKGTRTGMKNTPESIEKMRQAHTGVPKSPEHIANMRNRPQDTVRLTCPHCSKEGDYKNMKRWHMDRCKHNTKRLADKDPNPVTCTKCGHTTKQSPSFYKYHNKHCKSRPQCLEIFSEQSKAI
jgi:hypothetical protein